MKPSIVPATLHAPCAVDILVVFMSHFSLRLFNVEDDAWFNGSCILTRCWSLLAEIEDVSVTLPDGALCKPASSTCRARYPFSPLLWACTLACISPQIGNF